MVEALGHGGFQTVAGPYYARCSTSADMEFLVVVRGALDVGVASHVLMMRVIFMGCACAARMTCSRRASDIYWESGGVAGIVWAHWQLDIVTRLSITRSARHWVFGCKGY